MHRLWFPMLLLFIALGLGACKRGSGPQLDDPAPQVELPDFRGKTWQLPGDLHGKVWLVRFWSLDCHLCDKDILLGLETLRQKYQDRGFVPVAVNVGEYDANDERWQRFAKLSYPMLSDPRGIAAKKFGVVGLPTTFVIDADGILREKRVGDAGLDGYEQLITTIVK